VTMESQQRGGPLDDDATIAAFDFDGTLSRRDTMLPFLRRLCGAPAVAAAAAREILPLLGALSGRGDRDTAKAAMIARLLTGRSTQEARRIGGEYGEMVVASRLRGGAVELVEWHRRRGDILVLVSAGLDLYLDRVAEVLGFDHALVTRLEEQEGRLTGRIAGANVRGAEKARLLGDLLGERARTLVAYGNSAGDREMLAMAARATLVPRHGRLRPPPGA
jgi:phosphatidylglycerophosphatase C